MTATTLDTFIEHGTGALPRMIRLADGLGYWLSVTTVTNPDGTEPTTGQHVFFDVVVGPYVIPPKSWEQYADASDEFMHVPSHLVRALITEHGGEKGAAL